MPVEFYGTDFKSTDLDLAWFRINSASRIRVIIRILLDKNIISTYEIFSVFINFLI